MPRKKSQIPVPRLHKPSGRARIYVNETYIYLGPWGSVKANQEYRRIIAELTTGLPANCPEMTISELVALFLEWAKGYYVKPSGRSTGSFERYVLAVRPLISLYGSLNRLIGIMRTLELSKRKSLMIHELQGFALPLSSVALTSAPHTLLGGDVRATGENKGQTPFVGSLN